MGRACRARRPDPLATVLRLLLLLPVSFVCGRGVAGAPDPPHPTTPAPETPVCREFNSGGMAGLNEFASPAFPHKYPSNVDCVRVIFAPPGYDVVLLFKNIFQIETSYEETMLHDGPMTCPNDYLEVRDGRYSFSPLIGQFCGMRAPSSEIRARSGFMWLHFHSDNLLEYRGFLAEFEFLRGPINGHGLVRPLDCFFSFAMPLDGVIDTESLKQFYRDHRNATGPIDCVWQVQVPQWLSVALFAEEFGLAHPNQCHQNFLEVYAGLTAEAPLKRYCGSTANHVYANQATVFVRVFAADAVAVRNTHLRVLFSTYIALKNCSSHGLFSCGDDICIPQELVCSGRHNCLYGRDEERCHGEDKVTGFIGAGYTPLLLIVVLVSAVVVGLFAWYRPCRQREAEVDVYLKELCTEPPPGLNQTTRQRAASRKVNSILAEFQPSPVSSPSISLRHIAHHAHCASGGGAVEGKPVNGIGPERRHTEVSLQETRPASLARRLHSLQVSTLPGWRRASTETVVEVAELEETPTELHETSFDAPSPRRVL